MTAKEDPEALKLAGVKVRLKDGSYRDLTDDELLKMFPPGPHPETDFDGEEVMFDVMAGNPDPPGISSEERAYRHSIRAEIREAEEEDGDRMH